MRALFLLGILAACGAPRSSPVDAGVEDGGIDGGLTRLDWRQLRGPALTTRTTTVPASRLYAVTPDGFITTSSTWRWNFDDGALRVEHEALLETTSSVLSPHGTELLLVRATTDESCRDADEERRVVEGTLQLIDIATGAVKYERANHRTNVWAVNAFSEFGSGFFDHPIEPGACRSSRDPVFRSVEAPYAPLPLADGNTYLETELAPGTWAAWRGNAVGIANASSPDSFQLVNASPSDTETSRGWVHAYQGVAVTRVDSMGLDRIAHHWEPDFAANDWYRETASGNLVMVCLAKRAGLKRCLIHDMNGVLAERTVELPVPVREHFAWLDGKAVLVMNDDETVRLSLETGAREKVFDGAAALHRLGDDEAVIALRDGVATLVEATRLEILGTQIAQVVTHSRTRAAVLVRTRAVEDHSLEVLNLANRTLVTMTDRLYFAPGLDPLAADDVGQPWLARAAGSPSEQTLQPSHHFFFAEQPVGAGAWTVWVAPLDFSAPPRKLLEGYAVYVHAPRISEDGRIAIGIDGFDGATLAVTTARLEQGR